jgi:hypothetical protein
MPASLSKFIPLAPVRSARRFLAHCLVGVAVAAGTAPMLGFITPPEPEAIPRRWQLEIEPGALRLTTMTVDGKQKAFFYLTYRVINNSGEDLLFAPSFELSTEYGNLRSGLDVPADVTRKLMEETQNKYIEDQISIIGQLLQGKENAKDGIVIWPANDLDSDSLTIYAAGFSGETTSVEMPKSKEKVVLRKTYQMKYHVAGDMSQMIGKEITRAESPRWIMR